jgi:hypothetical protein
MGGYFQVPDGSVLAISGLIITLKTFIIKKNLNQMFNFIKFKKNMLHLKFKYFQHT